MLALTYKKVEKLTEGSGCLYLVATPIGNLEDITFRAIKVLQEVDLIAAEDTRHTRKLLSHYDIHTPLTSYHKYNELSKGEELLAKIGQGLKVALVSDAGMPGISDPGYELVVKAREMGLSVVPIPGATAALSALVVSGLPTSRFVFEGFLPRKGKERKAILEELKNEKRTVIIYEAPHRLVNTLEDLHQILGDRKLVLAREITKKYEEFIQGTITSMLEHYKNAEPKGEFTIVLAPDESKTDISEEPTLEQAIEEVWHLVEAGTDRKIAIKEVAKNFGFPKREVYNAMLKVKTEVEGKKG
ncbi:MAG TPA: 16S rRNA (cytidine(1402)-2'-O)-methyltransferase [Clostridia bacterium]|jgi:16S rRNA (cytidine1402-2'-O)-methyltransferase|nr:16S rRNA (cytidine(1402)-2'-O)-methyltransferase [Clostridia bacterium]